MFDLRWLSALLAVSALACGAAEQSADVGSTPRRASAADETAPTSLDERATTTRDESATTTRDESETAAADEAATTARGEPLCTLTGDWTSGELRAPRGGFEYAHVRDGSAEAQLHRREGSLRVDVELARAGWTLLGQVDPREDHAFRMAEPSWLREGVALRSDTTVRVLDARPGEVLVAPWRSGDEGSDDVYFIGGDARVRFREPIERWLPCNHVGFASAERNLRHELEALGMVADGDPVELRAGRRARLAVTPGGAEFAVLLPGEYSLVLAVLERRGRYARVLYPARGGMLLVGWTPSSSLTPPARDGGLSLTGRGRGGGNGMRSVCTSAERLTLYAAKGEGPAEHVGFIEPGTRFVRQAVRDDGAIVITPHPSDEIHRVGQAVAWLIRPSAALQCNDETS